MTRRLLVVRHAIAEDRGAIPGDDASRPLSAKGKRRFRAGARGIVRLVKQIDCVVSSPLVRARETADLLAEACGETPQRAETEALTPGAHPRELADWLRSQGRSGTVAVVGHEPHLSHLVCWLAASSRRSFIRLKKGSAVLLELPAGPEAGRAVMLWALAPAQLRALGGGGR